MISVSIDTISKMERRKQLHSNVGQWTTQNITLWLVQISGQSDFTIHFSKKKARSKARSDRVLEKNKKKSCVEEWVNADNRKYEEETDTDVIIPMDNDGTGIDTYTEVIPPDMVLIYAYDDDINTESNSNSYYKPKHNDDNDLLAKELPGGTSI